MVGDWTDFWVPKPQALMVFTWLRDWEHRLEIQLELNWSSLAPSPSLHLPPSQYFSFLSSSPSCFLFLFFSFTASFCIFHVSLILSFSSKFNIFTLQNVVETNDWNSGNWIKKKFLFVAVHLLKMCFIFMFKCYYWKTWLPYGDYGIQYFFVSNSLISKHPITT